MNFQKASELITQGEVLSRRIWPKGQAIQAVNGSVKKLDTFTEEHSGRFAPTVEDLNALDWVCLGKSGGNVLPFLDLKIEITDPGELPAFVSWSLSNSTTNKVNFSGSYPIPVHTTELGGSERELLVGHISEQISLTIVKNSINISKSIIEQLTELI